MQRAALLFALSCAACTSTTVHHATIPNTLPPRVLQTETGPAVAVDAITYARAQVGKPYCWGVAGPSCFDCSGLVTSAWAAAGVFLPRTSTAIVAGLPEISGSSARAGDIVAWPGHVGLYTGDGRVIDAGRAGGVVRVRALWGAPRFLRAPRSGPARNTADRANTRAPVGL